MDITVIRFAICFKPFGFLLFVLQSERGMTSRYLGSSGAQYFQDMMQFRQATDERVEMINFSLFDTLPNEINTKSKFKNYLGTYREQVRLQIEKKLYNT